MEKLWVKVKAKLKISTKKKIAAHWEVILQGLAYWSGWRKQYFAFHPLTEGAIVSEMEALCQVALRGAESKLYVSREVPAAILGFPRKAAGSKQRIDVVFGASPYHRKKTAKHSRFPQGVREIVEVKRGDAGRTAFLKDLEKLSDLPRDSAESVKTYLLVCGSGKLPEIFCELEEGNENFKIKRHRGPIEKSSRIYIVRRVCVSSPSINSFSRLNYAILVEVM